MYFYIKSLFFLGSLVFRNGKHIHWNIDSQINFQIVLAKTWSSFCHLIAQRKMIWLIVFQIYCIFVSILKLDLILCYVRLAITCLYKTVMYIITNTSTKISSKKPNMPNTNSGMMSTFKWFISRLNFDNTIDLLKFKSYMVIRSREDRLS